MFNFKRNSQVFLVYQGLRHRLVVYPDLSISQTFNEQSVPVKTLHNPQHLHESAVIKSANPASFNFTVPLLDRASLQIELVLAFSYNLPIFDLFIQSDEIIYKVERAVFERATFNFDKNAVIAVSLSGTASRISTAENIDGTPQPEPVLSYSTLSSQAVSINGIYLSAVIGINLEVAGQVTWVKNNTIHANSISFPYTPILSTREVVGSVSHYISSSNKNELADTSVSFPLTIEINGNFLQVQFPSVVFTRRPELQEIYIRTYDFRLNSNSQIVKPIYKGVIE